jgi:hypothetical protein
MIDRGWGPSFPYPIQIIVHLHHRQPNGDLVRNINDCNTIR